MKHNILREKQEVIIKYNGDLRYLEEDCNMNVEVISGKFAIVVLYKEEIELIRKQKNILSIEPARRMIKFKQQSNNEKNSCYIDNLNLTELSGKEIIFGFIDNKVDYMDPMFLNEDGTSNIISMRRGIFSKESIFNEDNNTNEWNREDINQVLRDKNNIKKECIDDIKTRKKKYEVLKNSEFIVFDLNKKINGGFIMTTEFIRGIKYLVDKGKQLNRPMVISTGFDILNGLQIEYSLFLDCIENIISAEKITMVAPEDEFNERALYTHGKVRNNTQEQVEFMMYGEEKAIIIELYKNKNDDIEFEVVSPEGESTGIIKNKGNFIVVEGKEKDCYVYFEEYHKDSSLQHIFIILICERDNLKCGKWKVLLHGENIVDGQYYLSLLQDEFIYQDMEFINNRLLKNNSRKFNGVSNIINVYDINKSISRNKGFSPLSTLQVSGLVARVMEKERNCGNDTLFYGEKMKRHIILWRENEKTLTESHKEI